MNKNILYELKRRFGRAISLNRRTGNTQPDLDTGLISIVVMSKRVNKAIILPKSMERDFAYGLTFIASQKNFAYGALFLKNHIRVFIDKKDIIDFGIVVGDYAVIDEKRHEVKKIQEYAFVYDVIMEEVENIDLENVIDLSIYHEIILDSEVTDDT